MREDFIQSWQSKWKLKNMKNPRLRELRSLFQINQVCKEENQRRNLNIQQFRKLAKLPRGVQAVGESKHMENEFRNLVKLVKMNFATPCEIFIAVRNRS